MSGMDPEKVEAPPGFEPRVEVLQAPKSPLSIFTFTLQTVRPTRAETGRVSPS